MSLTLLSSSAILSFLVLTGRLRGPTGLKTQDVAFLLQRLHEATGDWGSGMHRTLETWQESQALLKRPGLLVLVLVLVLVLMLVPVPGPCSAGLQLGRWVGAATSGGMLRRCCVAGCVVSRLLSTPGALLTNSLGSRGGESAGFG